MTGTSGSVAQVRWQEPRDIYVSEAFLFLTPANLTVTLHSRHAERQTWNISYIPRRPGPKSSLISCVPILLVLNKNTVCPAPVGPLPVVSWSTIFPACTKMQYMFWFWKSRVHRDRTVSSHNSQVSVLYFLLTPTRPSLKGVLSAIHGTLILSIRVAMRNKTTTGLVVQQQASNGSEQLLRLKAWTHCIECRNLPPIHQTKKWRLLFGHRARNMNVASRVREGVAHAISCITQPIPIMAFH